jgi:hypothetical protein
MIVSFDISRLPIIGIPHPYYVSLLVLFDFEFGRSLNHPGVLCRGRRVGVCYKDFLLRRMDPYIIFSYGANFPVFIPVYELQLFFFCGPLYLIKIFLCCKRHIFWRIFMRSLSGFVTCFVIFDGITRLLHMSCSHRYIP